MAHLGLLAGWHVSAGGGGRFPDHERVLDVGSALFGAVGQDEADHRET